MAVGGPAAVFDPPRSVWAQHTPNMGSMYQAPSGLVFGGELRDRASRWSNTTAATAYVMHDGHWGSWVFDIAKVDAASSTLTFGAGGFQEARGSASGAEYYVSHVLEELDDALEFFVDYSAAQLYFQPNGSSQPGTLVASQLPCILSLHGTRAHPISHVTISGLSFSHTANTVLRPYEVPSGGDWSVHRGAAVFVEGAQSVSVQQNRFTQLGSNALLLSDWNDDVSVVWNEFSWLGESAVVLLGSVDGLDAVGSHRSPMSAMVVGNLIREVGALVKQTAGVVQFLSGTTLLAHNAIFNAPRAAININDGHYGGTAIVGNALFNSVRETGDHGPLNVLRTHTHTPTTHTAHIQRRR